MIKVEEFSKKEMTRFFLYYIIILSFLFNLNDIGIQKKSTSNEKIKNLITSNKEQQLTDRIRNGMQQKSLMRLTRSINDEREL